MLVWTSTLPGGGIQTEAGLRSQCVVRISVSCDSDEWGSVYTTAWNCSKQCVFSVFVVSFMPTSDNPNVWYLMKNVTLPQNAYAGGSISVGIVLPDFFRWGWVLHEHQQLVLDEWENEAKWVMLHEICVYEYLVKLKWRGIRLKGLKTEWNTRVPTQDFFYLWRTSPLNRRKKN